MTRAYALYKEYVEVSMKSGLEGRNNLLHAHKEPNMIKKSQ